MKEKVETNEKQLKEVYEGKTAELYLVIEICFFFKLPIAISFIYT